MLSGRALLAAIVALFCEALLTLADALSLFVVTSYLWAWLLGGATAFCLAVFLAPRRRDGVANLLRLQPSAAIIVLLTVLPYLDREYKRFYYAYEQLQPGMPLAQAQELLGEFTLGSVYPEMIYYSYSPNPSTVDYIQLKIDGERVLKASYLWD